jgi:ketosteroid isomerase-like protein
MRVRLLCALAVGIAAAGCRAPARDVGPLSPDDVAAIVDVRERFVEYELDGAWADQAALYTEDAALLEPEGPVMVGRTAIRLGLEEFDIVLEDFKLTSLEIEGADGQAYDRGIYSLEYLDYRSGDTITETGNYLMVLRKYSDGTWLIAALIHNSNQSLDGPSSTPDP